MKQTIQLITISIVLLTACNKESIRGTGAVITENRNVPAFTAIEIDGDANATVSYGPQQQVSVTGYQNLLPVYETKLVGTTLHLGFKSNYYNVRNNNIRVAIVVPALSYLRTNGSGNIVATGFANGDLLSAFINGSGDITVENCKYNRATYEVNGSGNINGSSTELREAEATIHGSGDIKLTVTNKLKAEIYGSGNIDYWGNPGDVDSNVSGSGSINRK
jgi:hypothetical protein